MNFLSKFFFIFLIFFTELISEDLIDDETYYLNGVKLYDQGNFKESYIIFFNLSEKGNKDAIYNLSNMYFEGIGTTQNYHKSLEYTWLCSLNGNKKCIKKLKKERKAVVKRMKQSPYLSTQANLSAEHQRLTDEIQRLKKLA